MVQIQCTAHRTAATALLVSVIVALCGTTAAHAEGAPGGDDPVFGDGCRTVAIDTPTDVDPHTTVCRPW